MQNQKVNHAEFMKKLKAKNLEQLRIGEINEKVTMTTVNEEGAHRDGTGMDENVLDVGIDINTQRSLQPSHLWLHPGCKPEIGRKQTNAKATYTQIANHLRMYCNTSTNKSQTTSLRPLQQ